MRITTRFASLLSCSVLLCLAAGCSCGDGNMPPGTDGGGTDGAPRVDANVDVGPLPDVGPMPDTAVDTGVTTADVGTDAFVAECTVASDCMAVRGAPPCGSWTCPTGVCVAMCTGCTTDVDGDGFGVGAGCAGPDCDDTDRLLGANGVRSCYTGTGTPGTGVCRAGTETCMNGVLGLCGGQVVPGGEACNAVDDDCDATTDESLGMVTCGVGHCAAMAPACVAGAIGTCTPGTPLTGDSICDGIDDDCDGLIDENCTCLRVTTTGNDASGNGMSMPFRTVQRAIDFAAMTPAAPRIVCVAAGAACGATATYMGDVTMSNGISVYGRYESTTWTSCPTSTTAIVPTVPEGVRFGSTITTATALGGFRIDRVVASTTSGVTVDGSTNVTLTDISIPAPNTVPTTVSNSYGINLINGAHATITRSNVFAGFGTVLSIGVRSVGSTPNITNNCLSLNAQGICDDFCGANPGIRGRTMPGTGDTWAVLLDTSPGAIVETSSICANDADRGAGVRVTGNAAGTVIRGNLVNAFGGAMDSHGMWLEDCADAAPWIVNNFMIAAVGDSNITRVDGVRAIGACHPVIDSNVQITGGAEGGATGANGVYCGANAAHVASRCAVLGNARIEGSSRGFPPTAVGVRCDDGGCLRIERNHISGRGGVDSWGIYLGVSGTFVDGNVVSGGCSSNSATGIYAAGSAARIQNNFVHGYDATQCLGTPVQTGNAMTSVGMHVLALPGANEVDVNGNTIEAHQSARVGCTAMGLRLEAMTGTTPGPHGIFRNDIFHAAGCAMNFVVREESATADPRIFTNDDLDPTGTGSPVLYVNESTTSLSSAAMVNALTDAMFAGIVSVDPMYTTFPTDLHIAAASMCVGAGTATGAPAQDYDRMSRAATPAIGADQP